jgi:hypothetical protein
MKREEEHTHKQHRKKNEKLEKKLARKKNRQKDKEQQKEAKASETESAEAIIEQTKRTIIKKLMKHDPGCIEDLPTLFGLLDSGDEVNLTDMEDAYAKHKLYKLLKLFAVPRAPRSKYTFQGKAPTATHKGKGPAVTYQSQVRALIQELAQGGSAKPEKKHKRESTPEDGQEEPQQPSQETPAAAAIAGTQPGPNAHHANTTTNPNPNDEDEEKEKEKAGEGKPGELKGQVKKSHDFLAKTMQVLERSEPESSPLVGPAAPEAVSEAAPDAAAAAASEYEKRQEMLAEYNKIFRPKTLMEEHQEKMTKMKRSNLRQTQGERLKQFMSRPFDREKDLQITRVASKDVFQALYSNDTLASKFTSSHFLQNH